MEKYYNLSNLALTIIAFATRFYYIWYPNEVVFDEVHFGKFASYYLERTYFFDLHPPFAKLLIALVGYIIGFNGKFKFDNIGDSYIENSIPYIPLRALSATLGALTVPIMFNTLKECGYSIPACAFAASLVLFDNAHVAETRLILLDATLIISVAASVYCYVRFTKQRYQSFSLEWYKWLFLTGVSLSCVISTKYVGVFTFACVGIAVAWDLWELLDVKKGLTIRVFARHFIHRAIGLIVIPFIIYLSWFYIHFAVLNKSGPGDAFMSTDFQETLGDSPLAREAKEVFFHDIITIKHKDTECLLHSHSFSYPLRYDDGRISSQGQQVTCMHDYEDINNYWEILPVHRLPVNQKFGQPVKQGDTFRLKHVQTNGYLLAHDVASPLFPTNEEFTVVNIEEGDSARFNDTLFRFDPFDKRKGDVLKSKASVVKIIHVPTIVTMWTHDDELLPDWGFNQQEVNGNKKVGDADNYWTIDSIIGLKGARAQYVPKEVKHLPFLTKWWELQLTMFEQNNKLSSEHPFASEPYSWPMSLSGVSFWTKSDTREQIYFIGNILGWWMECGFLFIYVAILLIDQLTRRREVFVLTDKARARLYKNVGFFFCGWATHYFPFFLMSRQKFLHHYLPAHLLAALFSGALLEFLFTENRSAEYLVDKTEKEKSGKVYWIPFTSAIVLLFCILISCFVFFAPLTYGNVSLSIDEVVKRQWMDIKLHFAK
ncbi:glycosyltransferase family 39 protein [[Candida] arabinofermentans NRRL YB-2248]|uniref:Dolichyl-phosphate-mannose--protein mannosyltransferase n=1 Tax=[Candida] arabinofermentans NRRL YB-2248 TaxID=983967 RepID=A0A1E4T618_9ASCO|nr:glycosyltransferase family 39 protein [[Candida] arabinofermentans NRRL YB-2248]